MESDAVIRCVWCGGEMERGYLCGHFGVHFRPADSSYPGLYTKKQLEKHRCISLIPNFDEGWFSDAPIAYVCRTCKKIVVPY